MIIEAVFTFWLFMVRDFWSFINLPTMPDQLMQPIDWMLDNVLINVSILGLFVRWETILLTIPILIGLIIFLRGFKLLMFILRKIPFLSIN